MLFRPSYEDGKVSMEEIYRSMEQYHSFNNPFKCGTGGDDPLDAFST